MVAEELFEALSIRTYLALTAAGAGNFYRVRFVVSLQS